MSLKIDAWNITSTGRKVKNKHKGIREEKKKENHNILKDFGVSF